MHEPLNAMILAAGRGERMRPLTDTVPKALLPVGGKPLIVHHIEKLASAGCRKLVINHAHLGAQIEAALGNGRRFGLDIRYSPEAEALETAGGIAQALPLLGTEPFVVVNADVFSDLNYEKLFTAAASLRTSARLAHLVLVPNPSHHPGGDFALNGDSVALDGPRFTFSGIAAYQPAMFESIVPGTRARLGELLKKAIGENVVGGELYEGRWCDVGTPQRLAELDRELAAR